AVTLCLLLPTTRPPPSSTLFPYTTLFRSKTTGVTHRAIGLRIARGHKTQSSPHPSDAPQRGLRIAVSPRRVAPFSRTRACAYSRSEEHTSELQSRENLVCRLLLEKKKKTN